MCLAIILKANLLKYQYKKKKRKDGLLLSKTGYLKYRYIHGWMLLLAWRTTQDLPLVRHPDLDASVWKVQGCRNDASIIWILGVSLTEENLQEKV